jgi:hypothetical protein
MSNWEQAGTAIIGGIIGYIVGGPTGAMYGAQLGLLAGSVLFPGQLPASIGPRMEDLQTTSAQVGNPVPDTWGTIAVPGTVIWLGPIEEVSTTEELGGKGGGPEQSVTTFTYFQPVAVGLRASTHGPIGGILRIWENGKLVYDVREQQDDESIDDFTERTAASFVYRAQFEVYTGTSDQLPDPTIESFEGVGNVPAFRELAYVIFPRRQLIDEQARRHPQWRFEIFDGTSEQDYIQPTLLPDSVFDSFNPNVVLPSWLRGRYITVDSAGDTMGFREFRISDNTELRQQTFEDALPGMLSLGGLWIHGAIATGRNGHIYFPWFTEDDNVAIARIHPDTLVMDASRPVGGSTDFWAEAVVIYVPGYGDMILAVSEAGVSFSAYDGVLMSGGVFWAPGAGYTEGKVCGGRDPLFFNSAAGYAIAVDPDTTTSQPALLRRAIGHYNTFLLTLIFQHEAVGAVFPIDFDPTWTRFVQCKLFLYDLWDDTLLIGMLGGPAGSSTERLAKWDPHTGNMVWNIETQLPGSTENLNAGRVQNHVLAWPIVSFTRYLDTRDGTYIDIEWDEQIGSFEGGSVFDGGGNRLITFEANLGPGGSRAPVVLEFGSPSPDDVSLATIVTNVCNDCGLLESDIDVSDLTNRFVHGYARTRPMSGRACIEPLRMIGFFDCVESGVVLKWPTRGKESVATIEAEELGAHEGDGDGPPAVITKKVQSIELPRMMRVHYLAPSRDYEPGEQISPARLTTDAVNDLDIDLVAALDDDQAAQIAEIVWADAWRARWIHDLSLDRYRSELEPADAIVVPVDGRNERMRIASIETADLILRRAELVRDDDGSYESTAVAQPPLRQPNRLTFPASTELLLLDLPALREEDDDAGIYAVAARSGIGTTWGGAIIYRSADGGTSWTQVAAVANEARVGRINTALPSGITSTWDYENSIDVVVGSATAFESRTEEDVLVGANTAAIGVHGRWEIVQFQDAEEISANRWRLSTLLRGRRGTEHIVGTSEINDRFVLLSGPGVVRLPLSTAQIGVEMRYRGVTMGSTLAAATTYPFTGTGMALETFSPVYVRGERDLSEDLTITWIRRDRLHQTMRDGVEIPNSEANESYSIDILDEVTVVRTLTSSTPSVVYTAADQTTDFGAPVPEVTVHIYQLSAIVGRGTPGVATV